MFLKRMINSTVSLLCGRKRFGGGALWVVAGQTPATAIIEKSRVGETPFRLFFCSSDYSLSL